MTTVTLNKDLDSAVADMVANFKPEDKAPSDLLSINFSAYGVSMLFNERETVTQQLAEITKEDPNVVATIDGHGRILRLDYTNLCNQDPESSLVAIRNLHEIVGRAIAEANNVTLMEWVEIHSKANDMWFDEPF